MIITTKVLMNNTTCVLPLHCKLRTQFWGLFIKGNNIICLVFLHKLFSLLHKPSILIKKKKILSQRANDLHLMNHQAPHFH